MFRVVAALLLAVATLVAVDLSELVYVVINTTSPLERFTPTYVFEIDGCRVLVYMADPELKNSPLTTRQTYDETYYTANKVPRPLASAEVEKLLGALFQALGPSAEVWVEVWARHASWHNIRRYETLHIEAKDLSQLAEEVRRAVGADLYLDLVEAQEALGRGAEQVAYLYRLKWRRGDLVAYFRQDKIVSLVVMAANLSAAVEALERARETVGELWNSVEVVLLHGPYLVPDEEAGALIKAARSLESELEKAQIIIGERGWVRRDWRVIDMFFIDELGPFYVAFSYPTGTAPDRATAERLVRRFVELSGFCKNPLVVELWPRPGHELSYETSLWLYVAVGVAFAVAVGLVLVRRRR